MSSRRRPLRPRLCLPAAGPAHRQPLASSSRSSKRRGSSRRRSRSSARSRQRGGSSSVQQRSWSSKGRSAMPKQPLLLPLLLPLRWSSQQLQRRRPPPRAWCSLQRQQQHPAAGQPPALPRPPPAAAALALAPASCHARRRCSCHSAARQLPQPLSALRRQSSATSSRAKLTRCVLGQAAAARGHAVGRPMMPPAWEGGLPGREGAGGAKAGRVERCQGQGAAVMCVGWGWGRAKWGAFEGMSWHAFGRRRVAGAQPAHACRRPCRTWRTWRRP